MLLKKKYPINFRFFLIMQMLYILQLLVNHFTFVIVYFKVRRRLRKYKLLSVMFIEQTISVRGFLYRFAIEISLKCLGKFFEAYYYTHTK